MKLEWNKKYATIALYTLFTAMAVILFAAIVFNFDKVSPIFDTLAEILSPVFLGLVFAYLTNPIMTLFEEKVLRFKSEKRRGLKRGLAIVLTVIVVILLFTIISLLIFPQVYISFIDLTVKLNGYIAHTSQQIDAAYRELMAFWSSLNIDLSKIDIRELFSFISFDNLAGYFKDFIVGIPEFVSGNVPKLVEYFSGIANGFLNVLLGIFFSIYFLASKEYLLAQLKKTLRSFTSDELYDRILELCAFTDKTFGVYITGKLLDSLIVGVLCGIICAICQIPYALLVSVIVAICNVIPMAGPIIGAVPSAFIVFIVDPIKAIWFIVIIVVIMQLDGNIIEPKILGEATGLGAVWVLLSITVMGGLFGIIGMIIAVPIFALLYALFKSFIEKRLASRGLPTETNSYLKKPKLTAHKQSDAKAAVTSDDSKA